MIQYFPTITGSLTVNGDLIVTGTGSMSASLALNSNLLQGTGSTGFATTASLTEVSSSQQQISASLLTLTASYAALSSSYTALSGSYTTFSGSESTRITVDSASLQQVSSSQQQISASLLNVVANYATTGSNSFRANQSITGSLVVSSTITAQTLVVQTVTSSILYSSGSNLFGNALSNTQTFTGSVNITGSQTIYGNIGIGVVAGTNGAKLISAGQATSFFDAVGSRGISIYPSSAGNIHQITSDYIAQSYYSIAITARGNNNDLFISASGLIGIGTTTPLGKLDVRAANATMGNYQTIQAFSTDSAAINLGGGISLGGYYTSTTSIAQFASIVGRKENGTSGNYDGYLAFGTNAQATGVVERMRITSAGNVGIGVTNPQRQFVIADSSGNGLEISNSSGYSTLLAYNRTTSAYQNIVLGEGTGKVGVGTTSPTYKLQVRPTTDVNMIVTNNGSNLQIGSSNDAGNAAIILNFTATSFTFNNDVTFSTNISLGANQRIKTSGGAGNLTGSGQTTISSTIATIFSGFLLGGVQTGNLVIVNGVKLGTGWNFTDLVNYMTNGTITVISSSTVNTPPARTYTVSGNDLRLSIAGGDTGFVSCTALTQGYQA